MDWTSGWMVGCAVGVLGMSASASAQCADGTVEEVLVAGQVVGCAGAWNDPGVVDFDGAPVEPTCDRQAGNDSFFDTADRMRAAGESCTAADLCALGWELCGDEDAIDGATCGAGTPTGTDGVYVAATDTCDGDFGAQVVGCGNLGCASDFGGDVCSTFNRQSYGPALDPCATLNRTACNDGGLVDGGWSCFPEDDGSDDPVATVTKATSEGGGVLCCFREVCDCVDEDGNCYVDGEEPEECIVCDKGEVPGVPLTRVAGCGFDAGIEDPDAGITPNVDLGVPATEDLGPGPSDTDGGGETAPGISFRGDGGCECRTAGEGAPAFGLVGLVLFAFRRRP